MLCPSCGTENIEGIEACDHCGASLTDLSRPRSSSPVQKTLFKQKCDALRRHEPVIVPPDRKVIDVIASLVLHQDGCAVVVDLKGRPVGVFSERDLLLRVAGKGVELLDRPVEEFMTRDPVTIESDAPIAYALHQMDIGGYRHLPVVRDGRPVGMVSIKDILFFFEDRFLDAAEAD